MTTTTFDLKALPPDFADAITSATPATDLIIVDNQVPVARVVVCPHPGVRVPGLHAGSIVIADDFDALLSDEFWTGAA
jgi:antitoxin (DNA-binding transcriptional repressor) of toxin-antitoxin stability system